MTMTQPSDNSPHGQQATPRKTGTGTTLLVNACRCILSATFIFSGFVKAIDPLGTQYKIQDYLEAAGMPGVVPDWLTLCSSVTLSTLEFSLGIFLLFAIRRRLTARLMLLFMAVMTVVTLWVAIWNPVADCGCFGDAVKLTNGQTLLKNIALLACAAIVARWPLLMKRLISKSNLWIVINYTILFIVISSIVSLYQLPVFDFRPYHIGANIKEGMEIPAGAEEPEFETTFTLQKDGVRKEFTLENYPDSTWEFIDSRTTQTRQGYVPPIHDFSIELKETGEDITEQVLADKGYTFLLVSPHLELADDSNFGNIEQIYEYARQEHIPFYGLTASTDKAVARWRELTGAEYPFATTDATTLKTIIRSNPGLVLLKGGTVIRKWSHNTLPSSEELNDKLDRLDIGHLPQDSVPGKILHIVLWFVLPLFLLTLADRLWAWSKWLRGRKEKEVQTAISPPTDAQDTDNEQA